MKLYRRDYCKEPTESEMKEYEQILVEEKEGRHMGRKNFYY